MNKYVVHNMRNTPSQIKHINYPNLPLYSSDSNLLKQTKHKKLKYKSYQPEEPNHILYYFNNSESLKKIKSLKQRGIDKTKQCNHKNTNNEDNTAIEEGINIDKIINPFLIKNYSKKRNFLSSSLKKSQSASCNLNNTGNKTMSKIPTMFNGYVTRYTRLSPSELFDKDRYSKEKINIKSVVLNQKANQINHPKLKLKLFQMKQSIYLYKNEKGLTNRYKTCAVFNK